MTQGQDSNLENTLQIDGNTLKITLGNYVLSLKIEPRNETSGGRIKLGPGRTLFDLVEEAARAFVADTGRREFGAADIYHLAQDLHPDLNLRRNTWYAHVVASAPEHPSHKYHTSKRDFLRYHGRGKYSLKPDLSHQ